MNEKSVSIILKDGKVRHLKLEWPEACRLEKEHKISVFDFAGLRNLVNVTGVIWASLLHENPELTFEEVEKLLDIQTHLRGEYLNKITQILNIANPDEQQKKEKSLEKTDGRKIS